MSGTTLNWHIVESLALPPPKPTPEALIRQYARLALSDIHFAPDWLRFGTGTTTQTAARTPHERIRVTAMVDAAIAAIMGLSTSDLRHILAECDLPNGTPPAHPKGFWRVDKDKPPEQRQTVLTLLAFDALHQHGNGDPQRGLTLPTGQADGWPLPETIHLADHGLGQDARAQHHQPVASRLGPRFHDWQLAQTADEGTRERHLHARNLLGELAYARLLRQLERPHAKPAEERLPRVAEQRARYGADQADEDQTDILE